MSTSKKAIRAHLRWISRHNNNCFHRNDQVDERDYFMNKMAVLNLLKDQTSKDLDGFMYRLGDVSWRE